MSRFKILFPGVVLDRVQPFRIPEDEAPEQQNRFGEIETIEETRSDKVSPYIPGGRVRFFDRIQFFSQRELIYEFPIDPMVDVSFSKRIKETEIVHQERITGTVTEIISQGSPQVTIRGMLIGENGKYPYEELERLQALYERNESLEVSSRYFNALGIQNLVIKSLDHIRTEGYPDMHGFRIQARGDEPIELLI